MLKAYKYRLYPTKEQVILLDKHINACRFIYNLALETKLYAYNSHRVNINKFELMRQVTDLKTICPWLMEIDSNCLHNAIKNLDKAFDGFFKKRSSFPNFKSKTTGQSFTNHQGKLVSINGNKIYFTKFRDGIKFVQDRVFIGSIRQSIVSKTPTGKYYISLLVEDGKPIPVKEAPTQALGIDLGLSHFIITSEGVKVDNPRHLKKSLSHLKFLQRQASKKKKESANRKKANLKVAICHEKICNQRKDFLQKLSTKLISDNQALCFEDLNVEGMKGNHKLAQAITDVGWSEFVRMCKYKAEWSGKHVLQISRFQPSTKVCSVCNEVNNNLTLKDREWTCICGAHHDRDINAAVNIRNYCMKESSGEVHRKKPVELLALAGTMKHGRKIIQLPSYKIRTRK